MKRRYLERLMKLINRNYINTENAFEKLSDELYPNPKESEFQDLEEAGPVIMIDDENTDDEDKVCKSHDEDYPFVLVTDD